MTVAETKYSSDEIASRAREIYERDIKAIVEPGQNGSFVVIDVETGGYEIDPDELTASLRALRRFPNGTRFGMRVGFEATGRIGGRQSKSHLRPPTSVQYFGLSPTRKN